MEAVMGAMTATSERRSASNRERYEQPAMPVLGAGASFGDLVTVALVNLQTSDYQQHPIFNHATGCMGPCLVPGFPPGSAIQKLSYVQPVAAVEPLLEAYVAPSIAQTTLFKPISA
jgi:hypothetical protein